VYDWLLFLHVLSAAALFVTVVIYSAVALGAIADRRILGVANAGWNVGGLGTIVLGIWLAIYIDDYQPWDGWIIGAIVLWAIATELGRRAQLGFMASSHPPEGGAVLSQQALLLHWLRSLAVLALLVVMIYKPGA
jgi:hypothetical protein